MERKVGEVFDFNGVKLRVEESLRQYSCYGCYFYNTNSRHVCHDLNNRCRLSDCYGQFRSDGNDVIFVEVKNEN